MNETNYGEREKKALVPVSKPFEAEREIYSEDDSERYRRKNGDHILYIRLYLLFFFLGACAFASKKWGDEALSSKILGFLLSSPDDFPDFCVKFAPLVFGSFIVYASGFTMYAPLLSVIYSSLLFLFSGAAAGSVIFSFGLDPKSTAALLLIGLIDGICIFLCALTKGISKIASRGIEKLAISDGMLYSVLYIATACVQYYIIKGICALLL